MPRTVNLAAREPADRVVGRLEAEATREQERGDQDEQKNEAAGQPRLEPTAFDPDDPVRRLRRPKRASRNLSLDRANAHARKLGGLSLRKPVVGRRRRRGIPPSVLYVRARAVCVFY